jgi:hypothetical protein
MSTSLWHLTQKQERLKREITQNLDILIGSVTTKGPVRSGFNLTTKINQKTVSRHIRKSTLGQVRRMTCQHKKLKALVQELSDTNWEIIKLEAD